MEILSIPCPECGHQLQLRDRSLLGQAARCPECKHKFLLEEQPDARRSDDSLSGRETIAPGALVESLAEPSEDFEPILKDFGRYKLLRELGQGAMGTVYLARDMQLDRQVALKIPKFRDGNDSTMLERFYREARSAATLRHPNICPVFDVGEVDGAHYLTMAYIEGHTLSSNINRQTPQTERQVVGIVRKLASALDHAHKGGVVHRDLKPANIMIDVRNDPIVMDFGLALQLETGNDRLTQTGMILGTPAYMSPEQVRTEWDQIGPPSDVYSLGIILFELLTGEVPFDGPVGVVMALVLTQEPPKPSEFRPDLDPQLEAICLKMMAKEIDDRYKSMYEVDAALDGFLKSPKKEVPEPKSAESALATAPSPQTSDVKREPRETSRPSRQTVADNVSGTEPQHQEERRLTRKIEGRRSAARTRLSGWPDNSSGQLLDDPFWKRWFIPAAAVLFVTLSLTIATVTQFLVGGDGTRTPEPQPNSAIVSLLKETKKDVAPIPVLSDNAAEVRTTGDDPTPPTVPADSAQQVITPDTEPPVTIDSTPTLPQTISKATQTLEGHSSSVTCVAFSPDGRRIVSGSGVDGEVSGEVRLWDTESLQAMLTRAGHTRSVAFSPDGRRIVSGGGGDRTPKLWDAESGQETLTFKGDNRGIISVAFSPDGRRIVTSGFDRTLGVWDAETGQQTLRISGHTAAVLSVAFSPDGRRIVSGSWDKTLKVWDAESGQETDRKSVV
jgi:serine/threonine protein kinase/DNA-directed RNA polymerase subunit RPC12/RpoP